MAAILITQLPYLNTVVIKQKGVRLFVAAPDSLVIGRDSYLSLLGKLLEAGFLDVSDIEGVLDDFNYREEKKYLKENEDED